MAASDESSRHEPGFVASEAAASHQPAFALAHACGYGVSVRRRSCTPALMLTRTSPKSNGSVMGVDCRVQHVGIEREHRDGDCGGHARAGHAHHEMSDRVTRQRKRQDGNRDAGCAGPVERIDLDGKQVEQMRQRQPHGADLRILGRQAVEHAARHDEMRLRIVMAERESLPVVEESGSDANHEAERCEQSGKTIGHFATRILISEWLESQHGLKPSRSASAAPGLFIIAFLDSSFLSFPEVNDLLIVLMVINHPERMVFYATMATLGSIAGCLALYFVGPQGRRRAAPRSDSRAATSRAPST